MLCSLNNVLDSTILAKDGELGRVYDLLFDDRAWTVRYLVVETGSWLSSRRVLLSPSSAGRPDWERCLLPVNLTMDQVRRSPDVDTAEPVSRQDEIAISQYYGWRPYWSLEPPFMPAPVMSHPIRPEGDPHLRSTREISTYGVKATDAELGRIDDLIMEDANWLIRFLVVTTGSWFSGQKLLLSTRWVNWISWSQSEIHVVHSRQEM